MDVLTDIVPSDGLQDLAPFDDTYLHQGAPEQPAPQTTDPPPENGSSKKPATDGSDIDAMPIVAFCRSFLQRLEQGPELPADERQVYMAKALGDLLGDMTINDLALGEIAQSLYDADRESYEVWADNQLGRGLVLAVATFGLSGRLAANIVALFRPKLLHELCIDNGAETVLLDTALGALCDHAAATAEIRRATRSGEARPLKIAAQHARILSAAQPLLKVFQTTIERLRKKKAIQTLNIQAAGGVAVQVNEVGEPRPPRAKDEAIVVAEMELPRAKNDAVVVAEMELPPAYSPEAEPDLALEVA